MKIAIASETLKNGDYRVWYLNMTSQFQIIAIGAFTREEILADIMKQIRRDGHSSWWAFLKGRETLTQIELFDFIGRNTNENTDFGELPTLREFQNVINYLDLSFELVAA